MSTEPEFRSNRGRPPNVTPRDKIHISVERDVLLYWQMRLYDEFTKAPKKGALGELVTRLLREEQARQEGKA